MRRLPENTGEGRYEFGPELAASGRGRTRLAANCDDGHLAERLLTMAVDLAAKADRLEEFPNDVIRRGPTNLSSLAA